MNEEVEDLERMMNDISAKHETIIASISKTSSNEGQIISY